MASAAEDAERQELSFTACGGRGGMHSGTATGEGNLAVS